MRKTAPTAQKVISIINTRHPRPVVMAGDFTPLDYSLQQNLQ
jgi:hypothetical protein